MLSDPPAKRTSTTMLASLLCGAVLSIAGCGGDDDSDAVVRQPDVTVANLNVLHGLACPPETENCRLEERIELLFEWIVASGCPDIVTMQEVWRPPVFDFIQPYLAATCPFPYQAVFAREQNGPDEELILTRYPATDSGLQVLLRNFRRIVFVRIDHPVGPIDVFSTHLAAGVDGGRQPCGADCPDECVAGGAATVRDCQAVQAANYIAARHDSTEPAIITGDFNDPPGSFVYDQFAGRGWTDAYLAAGNPECDPASGVGCTSGRVDDELTELESPASNEDERIDYIFVIPPGANAACAGIIDSGSDADGDGIGTHIFAGEPNPFADECGARPSAICWPSDHEGMQLDLNCG